MEKNLELLLDRIEQEINYKLHNNTVRDLLYFTNYGSFYSEKYASLSLFDIIVLSKIDLLLERNIIDDSKKRELIDIYNEYKVLSESTSFAIVSNSSTHEDLINQLDKLLVITNKLNEYGLLKSFSIKDYVQDNYLKEDNLFNKKLSIDEMNNMDGNSFVLVNRDNFANIYFFNEDNKDIKDILKKYFRFIKKYRKVTGDNIGFVPIRVRDAIELFNCYDKLDAYYTEKDYDELINKIDIEFEKIENDKKSIFKRELVREF